MVLGVVSCLFATQVMAVKPPPFTAELSISGEIQLPLPCKIMGEGGKTQITVDFGDAVSTTRIDGVNYRQPIDYFVKCEAGVTNVLALKMTGTSADFGTGLLKTSIPGLAIKLTRDRDTVVALDEKVPLKLTSQAQLYATPVQDGKTTLPGKEFTASGTLHVVYY